MVTRSSSVTVPLAALLLAALSPGQGTWSDAFARAGLVGRVFALDTFQGELIAGGTFGHFTGELFPTDALRFDGRRWHSLGGRLGVDGTIRAFATFQGELIAGGVLNTAGGQPVGGVAAWNGTSWRSLGQGLGHTFSTPEVFALTVYQNQLYAGGFFDLAGGRAIVGIARWDGSQWLGVGNVASATTLPPAVMALKVGSDGWLYVGGDFASAGGITASNIARWNGSIWQAVGSTLTTGPVRTLEEFQGQLHAGGDFNSIGGVNAERIARWNGSAWSALGGGLTHIAVHSQALSMRASGGLLLVAGHFDAAGSAFAANAARWDGTAWHFIGGVTGPTLATAAIASTLWNGRWVVGGEFETAGATATIDDVASKSVVAFDGRAWQGLGEGLGTNKEVNKLVAYGGGVVALGRFDLIGDLVTSAAAFFDGIRWRTLGGTFDAAVLDAVEFQGTLVAVGQFLTVGGRPANGVAQWNGTSWQPMGQGIGLLGALTVAVYQGQLYVGGYGPPMVWTGTTWQPLPVSLFGATQTMAVHNGLLYLGGEYNVSPSSADVVSWDGSTLRAVGGDFDASVTKLAVFNNQLLAGGWFTAVGGLPVRRLAVLGGASWSEFGGGFATGSVNELGTFRGQLVMGGNVGGANVQVWSGSAWLPLARSMNGSVATMLADELAGHLWIGGVAGNVETTAADGLTRFELREPWANLGMALPGAGGPPTLVGLGTLASGSDVTFRVASTPALTPGLHVLGSSRIDQPLLGGTLVPAPIVALPFTSDALGVATLGLRVPFALAPGTELFVQSWLADGSGPQGVTATNAIFRRAP